VKAVNQNNMSLYQIDVIGSGKVILNCFYKNKVKQFDFLISPRIGIKSIQNDGELNANPIVMELEIKGLKSFNYNDLDINITNSNVLSLTRVNQNLIYFHKENAGTTNIIVTVKNNPLFNDCSTSVTINNSDVANLIVEGNNNFIEGNLAYFTFSSDDPDIVFDIKNLGYELITNNVSIDVLPETGNTVGIKGKTAGFFEIRFFYKISGCFNDCYFSGHILSNVISYDVVANSTDQEVDVSGYIDSSFTNVEIDTTYETPNDYTCNFVKRESN
jgi:hypothetical protein